MKKPIIKKDEEINLQDLKDICQSYINFIDDDELYMEDNDYKHHIFEEALTAIFGDDVWDYINQRRQ